MRIMYSGVTINLSHLASKLILILMEKKQGEVDRLFFAKTLYLAGRKLRSEASVHCHPSLEDPESYGVVLDGRCAKLEQFLAAAVSANLIVAEPGRYRFLPKLGEEYRLDQVRLENPVVVYANEAAPVREVDQAIEQALEEAAETGPGDLARMRFDDELIAYRRAKKKFHKPEHREINAQEQATESGEPFLLATGEESDFGCGPGARLAGLARRDPSLWRQTVGVGLPRPGRALGWTRDFPMGSAGARLGGLAQLGKARLCSHVLPGEADLHGGVFNGWCTGASPGC